MAASDENPTIITTSARARRHVVVILVLLYSFLGRNTFIA
jgi:hypothetical protein